MTLSEEDKLIKRRASLIFGFEEGLTMVEIGLAIYQGSDLANRNHIAFFTLISNGLERIMKVILILHALETTNVPLSKTHLKKGLNHGINKLKDEIVGKCFSPDYLKRGIAVADQSFLQNDSKLKAILDILDEFANKERYFYLDAVNDPLKWAQITPTSKWWAIEGDPLDPRWFNTTLAERQQLKQENISNMIYTIEKFVRALSRLLTYGSLGSEGITLAVFANKFARLSDEKLGKNKYQLDAYTYFL